MYENVFNKAKKKLGFGLMRLPHLANGETDIEQTKKMIDLFMENGFTYFDTAYVYDRGKSEEAMREAVVKRYPRDAYTIADKLPLWTGGEKSEEAFRGIVNTSLSRLGLDYFDYYLLHGLHDKEEAEKANAWEFVKKLKEEGKAKHIGMSFHGSPEALDEILSAHPECEFVQLQINYKDWEDPDVASRRCYETATKHGRPIIVMEPVKGGRLAKLSPDCVEPLDKLGKGMSPASYAIRFAASLENVKVVLSGMSDMAQTSDNVSYMKELKPLDKEEYAAIDETLKRINSIPLIACTGCKYCVDGCPMKIRIPEIFETVNELTLYGDKNDTGRRYNHIMSRAEGDCIECGACEDVCPQHLPIRAILADAKNKLKAE